VHMTSPLPLHRTARQRSLHLDDFHRRVAMEPLRTGSTMRRMSPLCLYAPQLRTFHEGSRASLEVCRKLRTPRARIQRSQHASRSHPSSRVSSPTPHIVKEPTVEVCDLSASNATGGHRKEVDRPRWAHVPSLRQRPTNSVKRPVVSGPVMLQRRRKKAHESRPSVW